MTDDSAVAGDLGGYVPCGGMAALIGLPDSAAAIFGEGEGYVPTATTAGEPASFDDTAAVYGSEVGFVAKPCVPEISACGRVTGTLTADWPANGNWFWEPGDVWTPYSGGVNQLLDSALARNFYYIPLTSGPYRHVTEVRIADLQISGFIDTLPVDIRTAIAFTIYKSTELYGASVQPTSNNPSGVAVYSGTTEVPTILTTSFTVPMTDADRTGDDTVFRLFLVATALGANEYVGEEYGLIPTLTYDYYDEVSNYGPTLLATTPLTYTHLADTGGGFTDETGGVTWSWSSGSGTRGAVGPMLPDSGAVTLDGGGFPYVFDVGGLIHFGNGPQTFMAWINPDSVSGNQSIMCKQTGSFYFRLLGDKLQLTRFNQADIGSSTTSVGAGVWTHVAMVYDGSNGPFRFYINGVADADINTDPNLGDTSSDLLIGLDQFAGDRFIGSISDVALWGRALSGTEVATIYAARECE